MTNLDSILKSRVEGMAFPVVMYGCKSWMLLNCGIGEDS